jgi:hypothetical protein
MKAILAALILGAGMIAIAPSAFAHHSVSGDYFMDQKATVEGDLVQFLYRNPHSFVEVKGKDPGTGELVTYSVEWNGAGRLGRVGVTAATLKPGDHVIITGQPGRNASDHRLHMLNITRPSDGWKWNRGARY